MLSELVPTVAGVGGGQMVVIVDVVVLDDSGEFGLAELFVLEQVHPLQLSHSVHQGL